MDPIILFLYALVAIGIYMLSVLCFVFGFFVGKIRNKERAITTKPIRQNDEIALKKAKRLKQEVANMLSYNGDLQEEILND